MRVGIIGCGDISATYLQNAKGVTPLEVTAVADLDLGRAQRRATEFGIPQALGPDALLASPDVDVVLNLTVPAAHAEVSRRALEAGKHVYTEKPLAVRREDGQALMRLAGERGLRVGSAPDTFLGASLQTCRQALGAGLIGRPLAATAFMLGHGPEDWHPNPEFFYQPGAGPLFDMGPYYLTALISLLGPIRSVTGQAARGYAERTIGSGERAGGQVQVNTPTHITGLLDFAGGAVGTLITSFDVWHAEVPRIEIYGTEGTLSVPDPNMFGDPVRVRLAREESWRELPFTHPYAENSRGLGLRDMLGAIQEGRPHRASGELALHVLDAMQSILESAEVRRTLDLGTTTAQPEPMPIQAEAHAG